jgi:hypothetical protein
LDSVPSKYLRSPDCNNIRQWLSRYLLPGLSRAPPNCPRNILFRFNVVYEHNLQPPRQPCSCPKIPPRRRTRENPNVVNPRLHLPHHFFLLALPPIFLHHTKLPNPLFLLCSGRQCQLDPPMFHFEHVRVATSRDQGPRPRRCNSDNPWTLNFPKTWTGSASWEYTRRAFLEKQSIDSVLPFFHKERILGFKNVRVWKDFN